MITRGTFGTFGSFAANSLLLAGFVQSLAWLPDLRGALPQPLSVVHNLSLVLPPVSPFQPFINNPISPADKGPRCGPPGPQGTTFYVKEAPLPTAFNSYPDGRPARFVCVRLDRHGIVREVRLPGGGDPSLVAMIEEWWRFAPDCASAGKGGWQRVRLTRWQEG
jgi:hypothetical protein